MQRLLFQLPVTLLLLAASGSVVQAQQSISIDVTPKSQPFNLGGAVYHVDFQVSGPFRSTIELSAEAPTLSHVWIEAHPQYVNEPYLRADLRLIVDGLKDGKTHQVVITAKGGASVARDTVYIVMPDPGPWRTVTDQEISTAGFEPEQLINAPFALDRNLGIGWFALKNEVVAYDGKNFVSIPIPASDPERWPFYPHSTIDYRTLTVDDRGDLWLLIATHNSGGALLRLSDGNWDVYAAPNASSGLTALMLESISVLKGEMTVVSDGTEGVYIPVNGGLIHFDGTSWELYTPDNSIMPTETVVSSIVVDTAGDVWMIVGRTGLVQFDGVRWTLREFPGEPVPQLRDIVGATDEGIWLQTDGGAALFRMADTMLIIYTSYPHLVHQSGSVEVVHSQEFGTETYSVEQDAAKLLWMRRQGSIARVGRGMHFDYSFRNSGLPGLMVRNLAADNRGRAWVFSGGHLTLLDTTVPPEEAYLQPTTSVSRGSARFLLDLK